MATASARIALVALVVAAVFIAGCAAATPSPRTIGLHVENRLGNIVLFSVGVPLGGNAAAAQREQPGPRRLWREPRPVGPSHGG